MFARPARTILQSIIPLLVLSTLTTSAWLCKGIVIEGTAVPLPPPPSPTPDPGFEIESEHVHWEQEINLNLNSATYQVTVLLDDRPLDAVLSPNGRTITATIPIGAASGYLTLKTNGQVWGFPQYLRVVP